MDSRLLMRKVIPRGYCVRQLDPGQQVREVMRRYDLCSQIYWKGSHFEHMQHMIDLPDEV